MEHEKAAQAAKEAYMRTDARPGGDCAMPARERTWPEMGLEQKVERLHRVCAALVATNNRLAQRLEEAHATAHSHMHGPLGQICVPPREGFSNYPLDMLRLSDHDLR